MINLFVDDKREPKNLIQLPPSYEYQYVDWIIARTSKAALEVLDSCVEINIFSLDYDLGGNDTTEPILTKLQEMAFRGVTCPNKIIAHSANPVGVEKIKAVAEFVERYRQ